MAYVIIGNGEACVGAIEGIQSVDKEAPVIVLESGVQLACNKQLLPYLLSGRIDAESLPLRSAEFYAQGKITLRNRATVSKIDLADRRVVLSDGECVDYAKLLIATGAVHPLPQLDGLGGRGVFSTWDVKDIADLAASLTEIRRVVVLGGSFAGLKIAESLYNQGVQVAVLETSAGYLLPEVDAKTSTIFQNRMLEAGIKVRTGVAVSRVVRDKQQNLRGVLLGDGSFFDADAIVLAKAMVPQTELAEKAGIAVHEGVCVDRFMRTEFDDIFAAGSVCGAVVGSSYSQGSIAGIGMAGGHVKDTDVIDLFSFKLMGLTAVGAGLTRSSGYSGFCDICSHEDGVNYRSLLFKEDKLAGYILVGDIEAAGVYTSFVKFKAEVNQETRKKMLEGNPDILLLPEDIFAGKF